MTRNERDKSAVARRIWLEYFNRSLYSAGVITEEERNKMSGRIKRDKKSRQTT